MLTAVSLLSLCTVRLFLNFYLFPSPSPRAFLKHFKINHLSHPPARKFNTTDILSIYLCAISLCRATNHRSSYAFSPVAQKMNFCPLGGDTVLTENVFTILTLKALGVT